jgi:hypothetical protein
MRANGKDAIAAPIDREAAARPAKVFEPVMSSASRAVTE